MSRCPLGFEPRPDLLYIPPPFIEAFWAPAPSPKIMLNGENVLAKKSKPEATTTAATTMAPIANDTEYPSFGNAFCRRCRPGAGVCVLWSVCVEHAGLLLEPCSYCVCIRHSHPFEICSPFFSLPLHTRTPHQARIRPWDLHASPAPQTPYVPPTMRANSPSPPSRPGPCLTSSLPPNSLRPPPRHCGEDISRMRRRS